MTTWKRGRQAVSDVLLTSSVPLEEFIDKVISDKVHRVRGTAVFMTLNRNVAPSALMHHLHHNKSLHQNVVLLSIVTRNEPDVRAADRVRVTTYPHGFAKAVAAYGYMESPDITEILKSCEGAGLPIDTATISFFLGRETVLPNGAIRMARWRKKLFIFLSRNARPATEYFRIPADRVIEVGAQIQI